MSSGRRVIRVLEIIKGLDVGGAERLLVERLGVTSEADIVTELAVVTRDHLALLDDARSRVPRVHLLGARSLLSIAWVLRLRKLLVACRYDVIHMYSPAVAVVVRAIVRTLPHRPALVSTEHSVSYHPLTQYLNRMTIGLDDHVIAVSSAVAQGPIAASVIGKCSVIMHGVDLARIDELRGQREALAATFGMGSHLRVATVANLRPPKQLQTLLAAIPTVLESHPDAHFYVAGTGPEECSLRELSAKLAIDDRLHLLGAVQEASRLTSCADVFALSSRYEGLPVAVMEALALGVPVVSTDAGGVRELIQDGVTGLLVPVGDAEALARALIRFLDSAEMRSSFGNAALGTRKDVDLRATARKIVEVYRAVARPGSQVE